VLEDGLAVGFAVGAWAGRAVGAWVGRMVGTGSGEASGALCSSRTGRAVALHCSISAASESSEAPFAGWQGVLCR